MDDKIKILEEENKKLKEEYDALKLKTKIKYTDAHRKAINKYREKNRDEYNKKQREYYKKKLEKNKLRNMTPEQLNLYNIEKQKYINEYEKIKLEIDKIIIK
jgi:hypothetical protein